MNPAFLLLSVVAAALPVLCYLLFIWWLDRYEREPLGVVALTFLWGATGGVIVGVQLSLVAVGVLVQGGVEPDFAVTATVVAPLAEEPAKAIVLGILLLGRNFDNTTDGLVYGAATGLGFAMTENFFYFLEPSQSGDVETFEQLVFIRGLFTALMHCAASATFGAVLGRFRFRGFPRQWIVAPLVGYGLAVLIHGAFNGLLSATVTTGEETYSMAALAIVPVVGLVLFAITQMALHAEHKMIQRELEAEARHGVLPVEHARIIPFHLKRRRSDWLSPAIDKETYVKAATILAFRRHQARLQGKATGSQNAEIHRLRVQINNLLAEAGLTEYIQTPRRRF